jgi:aldose 1-epimerase
MAQTVFLKAHGFESEVWPQFGANVVRLTHRAEGKTTHILHAPETPQPGADPSWFGLWPMVPLCNRAFDAKLDTGFEIHDLPVNDPAGTNIHGFGWQAAWDVVAQSESRLVMQHRAVHKGPYSYLARMAVSLDAGGVNFDLSLTHEGQQALPYGMGFHPWFPSNSETRVRLRAKGEVYMKEGFRPHSHGSLRDLHDFSRGRPAREWSERAINFTHWDGLAHIDWPDHNKSLTIQASPNLCHPVLWSPEKADFVCFEPQSHAVGAQTEGLIRAIAPLQMLSPGQTMAGSMRFSLTDYIIGTI